MRMNVRYLLLILSLLCLSVTAVRSADSRELRLPATGQPAVTFKVPDKWIVVPEGDGVLSVLNSVPATVVFTLTVAKDARDPDAYITQELDSSDGPVPKRIGDTEIDGCRGGHYTATGKANSGTTVTFDIHVLRIDEAHLLSVTRMASDKTSKADLALGDELIKSIKVIR